MYIQSYDKGKYKMIKHHVLENVAKIIVRYIIPKAKTIIEQK